MSYKRLNISFVLVFVSLMSLAQAFSWTHLGPFTTPVSNADSGYWSSTGLGWIESLHVSEDGQDILAGTITSGLFRSQDGGQYWNQVCNLPVQYGVLDMVIDNEAWFIATGLTHYDAPFGIGVLKSVDEGKSWQPTGLHFEAYENKPVWALKRLSKKCLLAATPDEIYKSDDNGENWVQVFKEVGSNFRQINISNKRKTCVIAGSKLLISKNAGDSWKDITTRLSVYTDFPDANINVRRYAFAEDPNNKKHYLVLYSFKNRAYIDQSFNGDKTWTNLHKSRRLQRIDINHAEIAIAPGNSDVILVGGVYAYVSRDGGEKFKQVTSPRYKTPGFVHDDIRSVVLQDSLNFYLGTDGGVVHSSDGGRSWKDINGSGLTSIMIYGIGLAPNRIIVGCQDLGSFSYSDSSWLSLRKLYGDGGDALYAEGKIYTTISGALRAFEADDLKPSRMKSPGNKMRTFTNKLEIHPKDTNLFYFIDGHLYFYDGNRWHNLTKDIPNKGYKAMAFDINSKDPQQLLFAFDQPTWDNPSFGKKFHKSTDGGKTWENITDNLPILKWRYISSISSNAEDPNEICVSLGMNDQDGVHKVYRSTDGGESWINWSEGLPPLQSFKIEHVKTSQSTYIVSMIDGIYYRSDKTTSWVKLGGAIPNIAIRDFEIDYDQNTLYAATYGNGLWALKLSDSLLLD